MRTTGLMSGYDDGILTEEYLRCSSTGDEVNHGVLLVGYGTTKNESVRGASKCDKYWVVRNSWGPQWGQHGFFKLCADGLGSDATPLGTCLINKYAVWPTRDMNDIDPDF